MKTQIITPKRFAAATMIAGAMLIFSSCHKDSSSTSSTPEVTESQAAAVTTDAVSSSTGGMVSQVNSSAAFYSGAAVTGGTVSSVNQKSLYSTITCGATTDSTIAYASVNTTAPAYTYSLTWQNTLACVVPSTFTCNFTGKGSYTGVAESSSFSSTGGFTLTGLSASAADYTFSSNYSRTGTTTSKVGNDNTFNDNLTITSTNIVYDKSTELIVSGSATVSITVTSTSGNSYAYKGTLTFLGGKTASLTLNSGTVYNIAWN
jgi:hypothetical protein